MKLLNNDVHTLFYAVQALEHYLAGKDDRTNDEVRQEVNQEIDTREEDDDFSVFGDRDRGCTYFFPTVN